MTTTTRGEIKDMLQIVELTAPKPAIKSRRIEIMIQETTTTPSEIKITAAEIEVVTNDTEIMRAATESRRKEIELPTSSIDHPSEKTKIMTGVGVAAMLKVIPADIGTTIVGSVRARDMRREVREDVDEQIRAMVKEMFRRSFGAQDDSCVLRSLSLLWRRLSPLTVEAHLLVAHRFVQDSRALVQYMILRTYWESAQSAES